MIDPITHVDTQIAKIAVPRELLAAMYPASSGANAAPVFSMKYCSAKAVLLTSGKVMSYTVEITFGDAIGMKSAVRFDKSGTTFALHLVL
jgi:hypothetical protein